MKERDSVRKQLEVTLVKRRHVRRDVGPFALITYPLLIFLTWRTWDWWHPRFQEVLSSVTAYSVASWTNGGVSGMPVNDTFCRYVSDFFSLAGNLPAGVPKLFPLDGVDVEIVDPLLKASNDGLLIGALWAVLTSMLSLCFLLPFWSVSYKFWALFTEAKSLDEATHVLVEAKNKKGLFCQLTTGTKFDEKGRLQPCHKINYLMKLLTVTYASKPAADSHTPTVEKCVTKGMSPPLTLRGPEFKTKERLEFYKHILNEGTGYPSLAAAKNALSAFGNNERNIPIPSFIELFGEHAVQPLFVFQVFCVLLWLLDEYWQYSIMTGFMLVAFEAQLVFRRRKDLGMIQGMHMPPIPLAIMRQGQWFAASSADLLPGDVFTLAMKNDLKGLKLLPESSVRSLPTKRFSAEDASVSLPCDALILRGGAIVNEAMLTGESLPQMKRAIDFEDEDLNMKLDYKIRHKNNVLYAGTSVLADNAAEEDSEINGAMCYCLRTGFHTTQGKLIRTVLYSAEHAKSSTWEAIMFLCVLMVVALISSGYVLYKSWGLPNRNHFKLLLHCIMIVTSVVPPELPVTMSLTVTMALNGLFKKKLYCTEPFRIPLGGKLTYCCFDKTGTLTTSEVVLENVAGAPERSSFDYLKASEPELNSLVTDVKGALVTAATQSTAQSDKCVNATADCTKLPEITRSVMGICHGLVSVEKKHKLPLSMRVGEKGADQAPPLEIVGDPLEKTSCMAVNWVPSHEDPDVLTNTATKQTATIWRRFPFVSEAQRMTVVTEVKDQAGNVNSFVLCKGAPDRIQKYLRVTPEWYNELVGHLALEGRRVLCMAAKPYTGDAVRAKKASREELEKDMSFCGLLVFGCPIKNKTKETIEMLRKSCHKIARQVGMVNPDEKLWFVDDITPTSASLSLSTDNTTKKTLPVAELYPFVRENFGKNALCVRGAVLEEFFSHGLESLLIPLISVFARVSPGHKEDILRTLKATGETTLMCGDGTNDVGALKAADVGISLLNFDIDKIKRNKKEQMAVATTADTRPETRAESRARRLDLGLTARQIAQLENIEDQQQKQAQAMVILPESFQKTLRQQMRKQIATHEERMAQANLAAASGQPQATAGAAGPLGAAGLMEGLDDDSIMLKPGDASMASPFTYRGQNVKCVKLVVRTGKATLATVMMTYKLTALNSLATAFALSVLTLNGVKFGDGQATAEGLFVSILFMATSNAKTAKEITKDRVVDSLFDPFFYLSVVGQSTVHLAVNLLAWKMASPFVDSTRQLDGPFRPNLINTVIWFVNAAQHATTFTANYEGRPFLVSLYENKVLGRGLIVFLFLLFFLAFEMVPPFNDLLKLTPFPNDLFRNRFIGLLAFDLVAATVIGRTCTYFGRRKMTQEIEKKSRM